LQKEAVISAWDVDSIYKIPMMLHAQMLDEIVCHKLAILAHAADLTAWRKLVDALEHPESETDIAFVGKYVDLADSYKSLTEALTHAGIHTRAKVNIHYVDSEEIERDGVGARNALRLADGLAVAHALGLRDRVRDGLGDGLGQRAGDGVALTWRGATTARIPAGADAAAVRLALAALPALPDVRVRMYGGASLCSAGGTTMVTMSAPRCTILATGAPKSESALALIAKPTKASAKRTPMKRSDSSRNLKPTSRG
jgi:hypothetical protein